MSRYLPKWCPSCKCMTDWLFKDGDPVHCCRCHGRRNLFHDWLAGRAKVRFI